MVVHGPRGLVWRRLRDDPRARRVWSRRLRARRFHGRAGRSPQKARPRPAGAGRERADDADRRRESAGIKPHLHRAHLLFFFGVDLGVASPVAFVAAHQLGDAAAVRRRLREQLRAQIAWIKVIGREVELVVRDHPPTQDEARQALAESEQRLDLALAWLSRLAPVRSPLERYGVHVRGPKKGEIKWPPLSVGTNPPYGGGGGTVWHISNSRSALPRKVGELRPGCE